MNGGPKSAGSLAGPLLKQLAATGAEGVKISVKSKVSAKLKGLAGRRRKVRKAFGETSSP